MESLTDEKYTKKALKNPNIMSILTGLIGMSVASFLGAGAEGAKDVKERKFSEKTGGVLDALTLNLTDFDKKGGKPVGAMETATGIIDFFTANMFDLDKRGGLFESKESFEKRQKINEKIKKEKKNRPKKGLMRLLPFNLGGEVKDNDNDTSNITFYANDSEKVRIDKDGKVGIGTTSPAEEFHMFGKSLFERNSTMEFSILTHVDNGNDVSFNLQKSRGGSGTHTIVQSGDDLGTISFEGYDGNSYASAAHIKGEVDGTPGDGDMPGRLSFSTSADGSESPSERMRIDSAGVVMIGTTDSTQFNNTSGSGIAIHPTEIQVASTNNCLALNHSDGDGDIAKFFRSGTQVGGITVASSSTTFATSSDARLKDVTGSARGLDVINNLNPVAYNWKADNRADEGLIAQEVEEFMPNAVSQTEDGYYMMDYSKLVTPLIKAIQEQQEQIEALQSEINELKNS